MTIILASQSARRKQLLSWILDEFEVIPSHLNEDGFIKLARTPEELVVKLAQAKAREIAAKVSKDEETVIIAADTVVILPQGGNWDVIGKPKDKADATKILTILRGTTHQVYTGLCILDTKSNQIATDFEVTTVTFKHFSDQALRLYVNSGKPLDKAGAYGIQETGDEFVQHFDGSFTNIVGLPLKKLVEMLKPFKVSVKSNWQEIVEFETGHKA